jgi:hypothetical protein
MIKPQPAIGEMHFSNHVMGGGQLVAITRAQIGLALRPRLNVNVLD